LPDVVPQPGRLTLSTVRSHDQWNTTIYSDDDRYRGLKNLRTALFMNAQDMRERGLREFDLIDITSFARDGSTRSVYGYRAVAYNAPRGSVFGYMHELNVLCAIADYSHAIADYSQQSGQPLVKHLIVEVAPAATAPAI
jgi:anaerobic selenocysteine-containing dehydrogenase